ncbi:TolC family protein [Pedobacter antarcticus]|uniref:TolC family protein n=1 Tax=Pedobacter antarcticus TaxID=34086 RepID=UPI001C56A385|nr:TolC family protein [Pedobacter antarcticus]
MRPKAIFFSIFFSTTTLCSIVNPVQAQTLQLKEAIDMALNNYGTLKAKQSYALASKETVRQNKTEYLPNLSLAAQQDYGTINGQNGPLSALGGLNAASSGPALDGQNWNAAFGALYLTNVNWDFYTFGRIREKVKAARAVQKRDEDDLNQEIFQHEVRVSSAYLNLLAAQRLTRSQRNNLERAIIFKDNAVLRAKNGLIAGVDTSLAKAEVSNARIALTKSIDLEQQQANQLGVLIGKNATSFILDTASVNHLPKSFIVQDTTANLNGHPVLRFYKDRVEVSNQQVNYLRRLSYPSISMIGVFQGRGSGFSSNYALDQSDFTRKYSTGVNPTRANYIVGVGITWNLTSILRNSPQVKAQRFISRGLEDEYELAGQQLQAQLLLAETKIKNAMDNYQEAPVQVKAASDAYLQKSTLYKNGLTTLVDLTQALYTLNRAETDRDIAYTNVWQALLLKSAASGDFNLFINEF